MRVLTAVFAAGCLVTSAYADGGPSTANADICASADDDAYAPPQRIAEDGRCCTIINLLPIARDGLAVALHLELLKIARQVAQTFAVRQHGLRG